MTDRLRVAVVGTGRMGAAMAVRLSESGFPVVVFNRSREKAERVAATTEAQVADTARAAAAEAQVILVSLADDTAVTATYEGSDGLVAGLRDGSVVLESSTIDPQTVAMVRPAVERAGAALLDTPVSGSVTLVEVGQLTVMAGGDPAALDLAQPVLDALAAKVFHVGTSGSGATMKLAVNAVVHALNQAIAEALVLAEKAGVDRTAAYDVFAASAAGAPFVHYKRAAFEDPYHTPVAFNLALVAKDLALIEGLARRVGARIDLVEANRHLVDEAVAATLGERDMSALAIYLRQSGQSAR